MDTEGAEWKRGWAGVAGLCGGLLFFIGDMLFYGHWASGAGFREGMIETVRNASLGRLFAGGLVGPFAACLCIVGFWHVYLNVQPAQEFAGRAMLVLFTVLMVWGSAVHTLWTARGLAMKFCYGSDDVGCRALLPAVNSYWALAYKKHRVELTQLPQGPCYNVEQLAVVPNEQQEIAQIAVVRPASCGIVRQRAK